MDPNDLFLAFQAACQQVAIDRGLDPNHFYWHRLISYSQTQYGCIRDEYERREKQPNEKKRVKAEIAEKYGINPDYVNRILFEKKVNA